MSDTIVMIDLIYGIVGAWVGIDSKKNSESRMVRPLYKPINSMPFTKKFPIEIPESSIIPVEQPGDYPGQMTMIKFVIPDRELKDVDFERTPFYKIFGDIDIRVADLSRQKKNLERQLTFAEKQLEKAGLSRETKTTPTTKSNVCGKCGNSMTDQDLVSTGGFCSTPGCGTAIKYIPRKRL